MNDRENDDLSDFLAIVNAIGESLHDSFTNIAEDFGLPLRVRGPFVEDLLYGSDEPRPKSRSALFIPVGRLVELASGLGGGR